MPIMLPDCVEHIGEQMRFPGNSDQADFLRVLTSGLRETEAVLADLVGMDRLHEFDLSTLRAVLDQALEWNRYAQCLMGEMCSRGGYDSLAEMWFMLAGMGGCDDRQA